MGYPCELATMKWVGVVGTFSAAVVICVQTQVIG